MGENAEVEAASSGRPVRLRELAAVFARYANLTWGGGSATIAVLHEQIVPRRRWISELQFNLAYALSRLTPGTNLLACCTAVGWATRRWRGAIVALAAASLPCSLLVVVVTHFYGIWQHNRIAQSALRGALAAAVAIMFYTAWNFARPHIQAARSKAALVIPGAMILALQLSLSPIRILLLAAVVGVLWPATEAKK